MSRLPPGQGLPNPNARSQQGGYNGLPQGYPPNRQPNSGFNPAQGMNPSQGYSSRGNAPPAGYPVPANYDAPRNGANRDPRDVSTAQAPPRIPAGRSEKPDATRGNQESAMQLKVIQIDKNVIPGFQDMDLAAVSPQDFSNNSDDSPLYIIISHPNLRSDYVLNAKTHPAVGTGQIAMSAPQRSWCGVSLGGNLSYTVNTVSAKIFDPFSRGDDAFLGSVDFDIEFGSTKDPAKRPEITLQEDDISARFLELFDKHFLAPGQRILFQMKAIPLLATVSSISLLSLKGSVQKQPQARGMLTKNTSLNFQRGGDFAWPKIEGSASKPGPNSILASDFKFEDMGIGGLENEFSTIFRRAFASRVFPAGLVSKMGIEHVKGMLLYGPPGTGKTLIARQIGKKLKARPPKVINGPEVLNKFVGQSEENIRKLFADAEKEYKEKGDQSELHIIIFDELDAVCKQRGAGSGGGTGVGDSVVNQLLSKLDGVDQLNNILLIGMTNRKDMIDDALLRPGRLEVHIEISLPDESGRLEILKIHTSKQRNNGFLDGDVNLERLASLTKNFSGAELYGLVRAATSFAFSRHTEVGQMAKIKDDVSEIKVQQADFMKALGEVVPAYGVSEADLKRAVRLGIIPYGLVNSGVQEMNRLVDMVREDPNKFSGSILLHGPRASGKTALAAHVAMISDFPFVKMIRPVDLAGYKDDFAKKDHVHKAFSDAWKSPLSILILDDFEQLIGWSPIGPRYSTIMLEIITTLIRAEPPEGHRLAVLVTTSRASILRMLEVDDDFTVKVAVPAVANLEELKQVLDGSEFLDSSDREVALERMKGIDRVNVGIKTVFDYIFMARTEKKRNAGEVFSELMIREIQKTQYQQ